MTIIEGYPIEKRIAGHQASRPDRAGTRRSSLCTLRQTRQRQGGDSA
jgi:hypothetical protein